MNGKRIYFCFVLLICLCVACNHGQGNDYVILNINNQVVDSHKNVIVDLNDLVSYGHGYNLFLNSNRLIYCKNGKLYFREKYMDSIMSEGMLMDYLPRYVMYELDLKTHQVRSFLHQRFEEPVLVERYNDARYNDSVERNTPTCIEISFGDYGCDTLKPITSNYHYSENFFSDADIFDGFDRHDSLYAFAAKGNVLLYDQHKFDIIFRYPQWNVAESRGLRFNGYHWPFFSSDGKFLTITYYSNTDQFKGTPIRYTILYNIESRTWTRINVFSVGGARLSRDNKELLVKTKIENSVSETRQSDYCRIYRYNIESQKLDFLGVGLDACWAN